MNPTYASTVQLLLAIVPAIFETPLFAMKGGTALNLFVQDLPRLSVDIDVVFVRHDIRIVAESTNDSPSYFSAVTGPGRTRLESDAIRASAGTPGNSMEVDESRQTQKYQSATVHETVRRTRRAPVGPRVVNR